MQFKSLVAAGLLAGFTAAAPEPQSPEQSEAAISGISSYFEALATDPAVTSLDAFATNPSISSAVVAWQSTFIEGVIAGETSAPNFSGLPTEVAGPISSIGMSVYSAGLSILSADGFTVQTSVPTGLLTGIDSASAGATSAASKSGAASGSAASKSASAGTATSSTASQAGAAPTGALGAAVGVAAGFVGVVMAL